MACVASDLAEVASINLSFAQAELTMSGDRESVARALDHIFRAGAYLKILAAELDAARDEADEEAA